MYSDIKQIQIIVSLLKQYDIRNIVISPGTRHVPLVHSLESDSFFTTYSIVDERSAGYFALGLAEGISKPVGITCTSATATCNYLPAMQEAAEKGIPLLALTADRARTQRFHGENQCINQVDMYRPFTKCSVDLPNIANEEEEWYSNRLVNEALQALTHNNSGPVQINFLQPLSIEKLSTFPTVELPVARKIDLYGQHTDWDEVRGILRSKKRVLVACGQHVPDWELSSALNRFATNSNVVVIRDHFSNVDNPDFIHAPLLSFVLNQEELIALKPELIITYGSKLYSELIVKYRPFGVKHWHIDPEGRFYDVTHSLKRVFEMKPSEFFDFANPDIKGENSYLAKWKSRVSELNLAESAFTNNTVIRDILKHLPVGSTVHASVLNAMRLSNFYQLSKDSSYFGNICCDGIDGALSTFLGQARNHKGTALLIIGDLSYLYDMNGSLLTIPSNVRILLVNNFAGAEFHFNISLNRISTLNQNIAAGHHTAVRDAVALTNMKYLCADKNSDMGQVALEFFRPSDVPILLEVFTDADTDGRCLRELFSRNRKLTIRNRVGNIVRLLLGGKITTKLRKL